MDNVASGLRARIRRPITADSYEVGMRWMGCCGSDSGCGSMGEAVAALRAARAESDVVNFIVSCLVRV